MAKRKTDRHAVYVPEIGRKARLRFDMKAIEKVCDDAKAAGRSRWRDDLWNACQKLLVSRLRYYAKATLYGGKVRHLFAALPIAEIAMRLSDAYHRAWYGKSLKEMEAAL